MMRRKIASIAFTAGLACVLALAGAWTPGPAAADVNGDRAVDVRDLQTLVAVLLEETGEASLSDVNGDGQIDVLDFQELLGETCPGEAPRAPECQVDSTPLALTPTPRPLLRGPVLARLARIPSDTKVQPAIPGLTLDGDVRAQVRRARYLFLLTPHAPPA